MTRLPIQATAADGGVVGGVGQAGDMALSADGTKLAVLVNTVATGAAGNQALRVYLVSSGRLLHAWPVKTGTDRLASDLSWAGGDTTVAFAATWGESHTEMRTLNVTAGGTDLLADSHVVWSQYVPVPPHNMYTARTPRLCADPFLTADGQAVVCTNSIYSPRDDRATIIWLAYPISSPTSPRLLGSVLLPPGNPGGLSSVEWANASGSQVIGMWAMMTQDPVKNGTSTGTVNVDVGVIGGGTVQRLNTGTYLPTGYNAW